MKTHTDDDAVKVKGVHWQSVLSRFYTHHINYIRGNFCAEITYISSIMLLKASGSSNYGIPRIRRIGYKPTLSVHSIAVPHVNAESEMRY